VGKHTNNGKNPLALFWKKNYKPKQRVQCVISQTPTLAYQKDKKKTKQKDTRKHFRYGCLGNIPSSLFS